MEDAVRYISIRTTGVGVGCRDRTTDAEQLDPLRIGVRVWGSPAAGEGEAARLTGVPVGEVE